MIALIKNNGREYYSPVLVFFSDGLKSKVVVFDFEKKNIIFQNYWIKKQSKWVRCVYTIDVSGSSWVTNGKYSGFAEILDSTLNFKQIKKGKIPSCAIKIATRELEKMVIKEWMPIKNESDVESFDSLSFGLHDALVLNIEVQDGLTIVHFDTNWSCHILMKFYGVEKSNLVDSSTNYSSTNFDFSQNKITFSADLCWDDEITESPELICKRIEYKLLRT